ncbi:AAA family ATPase [Mariniflexile gromovii]|uniref:AAA family ATPase n=1 Tax=Mariniflexile gromovii TaxID=362523 RepID=A0ABS4BUA7_9FLAO|nr:AAA family ATPase [Mariniflexile gromovii]MBP0904171.1 AAA family ATPase [Mariniflexile gromovii]
MKKEALQQETKTLVEDFLKKKDISQNQMAELLEVSPATVTNLLKENWEKLNESMLMKIRSFFSVKKWVAIETANYTAIQDRCLEAREQNKMIGIVGFSGSGKTFALRQYFETNANTYLVTCSRSMRTKQFLSEILRALGVSWLASDHEMTKRIIDELNKKSNPLLIIDEASKLSANSLMYIQDIWDGIEDNGGIVLAGVEYLLSNIKKAADKNKIGMPEFYGRVNQWQELTEPTRGEINTLCEHNNVTDQKVIKALYRLGNYRLVRNAINNLNTL